MEIIFYSYDFIIMGILLLFSFLSYKEVMKQKQKPPEERGVSRWYVFLIVTLIVVFIIAPFRISYKETSNQTIKTFDKEVEEDTIHVERLPKRHYTTSDNEREIEIITKERKSEDE